MEEQNMNRKKKEVHTAEDGQPHIHVTISGAGEERNEAFRMTVEHIQKVKRRLRKRGIKNVSYKIEKSDG